MRRSYPDRRGFALLEAIIALAILGGGALTTIAVLHEAGEIEALTRARETEATEIGRIMTAMSLLSRHDLDRRLGWRDVRGYAVSVTRPSTSVYRVAIARPASQDAALVTLVYRP